MINTPIVITDPKPETTKYAGPFAFFSNFINDERDLAFTHLLMVLTLTVIPTAVLLYTNLLPSFVWWPLAVLHVIWVVGVNLGPYMLMLHNTSHRKLFKQEYGFMNGWAPYVIGIFFGQTPDTYFLHHIGMHHSENNLHTDLSSTMRYQRDKFSHFMHYYLTFFFLGAKDLYNYFMGKQRNEYASKVIRGEAIFLLLCVAMSFVNFWATLFVLILPFIIIRFGMMAGNWGQHAFVDPADPANNYFNSVTCINAVYNKRCFNDGYHIGHHLSPHRHWTDMAADFERNMDKYGENNAVVFQKLDNFTTWFFLMTKRYDVLAKNFVNIGNRFKSDEEVIEFLKSRTKPIA